MKTKVSIMLPVFNVEKYLRRCLDSVVNQTLKDIEIICATDGPEVCDKICEEYAAKDKRIKIIYHQGSYGKSCNAAIKAAKGEYIGLVECDDWCDLRMFEHLYKHAVAEKADVCKSGWYNAYDNAVKNKRRLEYDKNKAFTALENPRFINVQPSVWSAIYRTDFLRKNNIYMMEERISYIDTPFFVETFIKANKLAYLNEALYYYYQDNPEASVKSSKKLYDGIKSETFALQKLQDSGIFKGKLKEEFLFASSCHLLWNYSRFQTKADSCKFWKAAHDYVKKIDFSDVNFSSFNSSPHLAFFKDLAKYKTRKRSFINYLNVNVSHIYIKLCGIPLLHIIRNDNKLKYKFLGFLPLWSRRISGKNYNYKFLAMPLLAREIDEGKIKYKLLGLPLFSRKIKGGRTVYKLCGIPVWKIRKMANNITTKYYFCGIPVCKVSKK